MHRYIRIGRAAGLALLAALFLLVGGRAASVRAASVPGQITIPGARITAMAVYHAGNKLFVADDNSGSLNVVSGSLNQVTATIPNIGSAVTELVVNETYGKVYAASSKTGGTATGTGRITVLNAATHAVITQIDPGAAGANVSYFVMANDEVRDKIYVASASGVIVIDAATDTVTPIANIDYPYPFLEKIGINTVTNEIFLPHLSQGRLNIINGNTLAVTKIPYPAGSGQPLDIAVNEVENKVYLTMIQVPGQSSMGIMILDRDTGATSFVGADDLEPLAFNNQTNRLFAGVQVGSRAAVVNGSTDALTPVNLGVAGIGAIGVRFSTDRAYLATQTATVILSGGNLNVQRIATDIPLTGGLLYTDVAVNQTTGAVYVVNDGDTGRIAVFDDAGGTLAPPDPVCPSTIAFGQTLRCATSVAGETDAFSFTVAAGDRVRARMLPLTRGHAATLALRRPDGTTCASSLAFGSPVTLNCDYTSGGTATVTVQGFSSDTGRYAVYLQRLNSPVGCAPLSFGAAATSATLAEYVEVDCYTVNAGAGDGARLTATVPHAEFTPQLEVLRPTGATLCGPSSSSPLNCTLPSAGVYTVLLDTSNAGEIGGYTVALACTTAACGGPVQTDGAFAVSPSLVWLPAGGTATATIDIVTTAPAAGLGSWDLRLSYDGSKVSAASCQPLNGSVCNTNVSGAPNTVRIVGTNVTGVTGSAVLTRVTFAAASASPSTSALTLSVTEATTPQGTAVQAAITSGQIMAGLPGDANADGEVTSVDSLCIKLDLAGFQPTDTCPHPLLGGDVNGVGGMTALDALCVDRMVAALAPNASCPYGPAAAPAAASAAPRSAALLAPQRGVEQGGSRGGGQTDLSVRLEQARTEVAAGGELTVSVVAAGRIRPGAWTVDLAFDPAVVSVSGCATTAGQCNAAFGSGLARLTGSSPSGLADGAELGRFTLRATGERGSTTALSLLVRTLTDVRGARLQSSVVEGQLTVGGDGRGAIATATPAPAGSTTGRGATPSPTPPASPTPDGRRVSPTVTPTPAAPTCGRSCGPSR